MGSVMVAEKIRRAPTGSIMQAIRAARKEIAQLALQRSVAERRIEQLRTFIKSCAAIEGTTVPRTPTYAEHAMSLLERAGQPMTAGQLVDALGAAGTPVRGRSRKHRVTTLTISLRRRPEVEKTPQGYVLASTRRVNAHGA